jgi:hypothetical protein
MSLIGLFIFGLLVLDFVVYYCFHEIFGEKAAIFEQHGLLRARASASRISTGNRIPRSVSDPKRRRRATALAIGRCPLVTYLWIVPDQPETVLPLAWSTRV